MGDDTPSKEIVFDEYGFVRAERTETSDETDWRAHDYSKKSTNSFTQQRLWKKVLSLQEPAFSDEVAKHMPNGVPKAMRPALWCNLLNIAATRKTYSLNYKESVRVVRALHNRRKLAQAEQDEARRRYLEDRAKRLAINPLECIPSAPPFAVESGQAEDGQLPTVAAMRQIELDQPRTFYTHKLFLNENSAGQTPLFNILAVYAKLNPSVGYCQGMAYIVAVLLMVLPDEETAFWCAVSLFENKKFFESFYSESLGRVQKESQIFSAILAHALPDLSLLMASNDVHPLMFCTQWFMCAFTSLPLWDTVLSIWDYIFLTGSAGMQTVALALMQSCHADLITTDSIATMLPYLQRIPPNRAHRDVLIPAIWRLHGKEIQMHLAVVEENLAKGLSPHRCLPKAYQKQMDAVTEEQHQPKRARRASSGNTEKQSTAASTTMSIFRRLVAVLATPMRTPKTSEPRLTQRASVLKLAVEDVPTEIFSPSFARAGVLSPSFRGDLPSILTASGNCNESYMDYNTGSDENSGSPSAVDCLSPGANESFCVFKTKTPLRPSQAHQPSSAATTARRTARKRGKEAQNITHGGGSMTHPSQSPALEQLVSPGIIDMVELGDIQRDRTASEESLLRQSRRSLLSSLSHDAGL